MGNLRALFHFSRPHTIAATSFQVVGLFFVVVAGRELPGGALLVLLLAWIACLAANIYVVGLNQLTDVAIDRINKPMLPLASGAYSLRQGRIIVVVTGVIALGLSAWQSGVLLLTLALVMIIGSIYSLPPTRLKERPLLAAFSIALTRGVIANLGVYWHFSLLFGAPTGRLPLLMTWALLFFFGFGVVIALYKDIPDWAGDREFAVRTFAVRLGRENVLKLGRWLLTAIYLLPITVGLSLLPGRSGALLLLPHLAALLIFWTLSLRTSPAAPASMSRLYLSLWALFYAEYAFLVAFSGQQSVVGGQ